MRSDHLPTWGTWVLLHGTPLAPAIWRETARELTDQPVQIPDCTQVPDRDAQRRLAGRVAGALGDGDLDVVGHSFGGQIAIDLGLLRPQQVRSLTILCSRDTPFPPFARTATAVRDGSPPSVPASLARWFTADQLAANCPAVQAARRQLESASLSDWANALDAIATFDRTARAAELIMPVNLIAAGGDAVSTPAAMADFATRLPRATLVVQDGWMHMSPFVDPSRLAGMLRTARDRAIAW